MEFICEGCGYKTEDELDFLAHLTECKSEPESKWHTYSQGVGVTDFQPFKNSEILEEKE